MKRRFKPIELILIVFGLIIPLVVISEARGPSGDRVTGTVYDKANNEPLAGVKVGFLRRDNPVDSTDPNGIFYLVVPNDIERFYLIFVKDGYESKVSEKEYQSGDPVKHHKVFLTKPNPSMKLGEFKAFLNSEVKIYEGASFPFRSVINVNVKKLSQEEWVKKDRDKSVLLRDACTKLGGQCQ